MKIKTLFLDTGFCRYDDSWAFSTCYGGVKIDVKKSGYVYAAECSRWRCQFSR